MTSRKYMKDNTVRIVPFEPRHQPAFKALNEAWIRSLGWDIEEADSKAIDNPQGNIIDKGGYIFMALLDDEPMGTLAMYPLENREEGFELMKLAVSPDVRKNGIGTSLMQAAFGKARELGVHRLYLESNTRCKAAVRMYRRLGFRELPLQQSEFERCNIQMELLLPADGGKNARMVVHKEDALKRVFKGVSLDSLAIGERSMVTKMNYVKGNFATTHQHPHEQCGYVISGEYRLKVELSEGEVIDTTLRAGDSYAIPGNTPHSFEVVQGGEVVDVFTPQREDYL